MQAVSLFNSGQYFKCHEVIEDDLWRPAPEGSDEKLFYQGVLQVAVGLYHQQQGNAHGTQVLIGKGLTKLESLSKILYKSADTRFYISLGDFIKDIKNAFSFS